MNRKDKIDELLASIRAGLYLQQQRADAESRRQAAPFVTISRQAGAGGRTLAGALAQRLNEVDPGTAPGAPPWSVWDRELVEKVARDQRIPVSLIESLEAEGPQRSMFQEFLASLQAERDASDLDEFQLYRTVARTVRGLARAGRAIIVGRGGVYATADLPGGVHVRLVAPQQDRIRHMAEVLNTSQGEAAAEVRRIEKYRETFHRRYWKDNALLPEIFTLTLNAAYLTDQQMVDCIAPLIARSPAAPPRLDVPEATSSASV